MTLYDFLTKLGRSTALLLAGVAILLCSLVYFSSEPGTKIELWGLSFTMKQSESAIRSKKVKDIDAKITAQEGRVNELFREIPRLLSRFYFAGEFPTTPCSDAVFRHNNGQQIGVNLTDDYLQIIDNTSAAPADLLIVGEAKLELPNYIITEADSSFNSTMAIIRVECVALRKLRRQREQLIQ